MSKSYNIRWKQSDEENLRKAVRNFNDKIRRLEKKNPRNKASLPEKITVGQMKDLIQTRQDLNREINSLKRFSKRGAEKIVDVPDSDYNLKITDWQKKEMTRRIGTINRKRKKKQKEIAEIEMTDRGKKVGYKKGDFGMGKAEERALQPMKAFTSKMNYRDLQVKYRNIMKESQSTYWQRRDEMMRANYIKSLEDNFNPNDIKDVISKIQSMDFKEFRKVFEAEGGNFELSYPPDAEQYNAYLSGIKSIWIPNKGE